jgi:hypothetical protein
LARYRGTAVPSVTFVALFVLLGALFVAGCSSEELPPPDAGAESTSEGAAIETSGAPTQPAAEGAELDTVVQPPADTIALIDPSAAEADSEYAIEFEVYGWGPEAGTVVIYVVRSNRTDEGDGTIFDFNEENLVVVADEASLDAIQQGGAYTGTLVLAPGQSVLIPELRGAQPE